MSRARFTVVFEGDVKTLASNPFKIESPFGKVDAVSCTDALARLDVLEEELNRRNPDGVTVYPDYVRKPLLKLLWRPAL